ncbi:MAG: carboxylating nicotinate-nucleotide diphosphorylase [Bacteroidetes bacterium]|nr:carboxylating nicotinate-nucleotide diphosphorylase [Bacteroidota bacterium]
MFVDMELDRIIEEALKEDLGDGDHTSLATIEEGTSGEAQLLMKANGVLAGIEVAEKVFQKVDPDLKMNILITDGTFVEVNDVPFTVEGDIRSILAAERTVLNFMQRLSGIATETFRMVKEIQGTKAKILDTRKTTPLLRELEKYAVRLGGGENHRMGLYDMIMIKDNHVDYAKGIENAIEAVVKYMKRTGKKLKVEIEVRNFEELLDAVNYGHIDRIMLDNFSVEDVISAVQIINGRYETEASGGIILENVRQYAETGVDFISLGSLTHQIKSLDMSMKAVIKRFYDNAPDLPENW